MDIEYIVYAVLIVALAPVVWVMVCIPLALAHLLVEACTHRTPPPPTCPLVVPKGWRPVPTSPHISTAEWHQIQDADLRRRARAHTP